jgi:dienelactone hydrolase
MSHRWPALIAVFLAIAGARGEDVGVLAGTRPLTTEGDLSAQMRAGMRRFLLRETERSIAARQALWKRDGSSRAAYERSIEANRQHLRRYVGAVDRRQPVRALESVASTASPAEVARTARYTVHAVRWPVLEGIEAEGLLLQPPGRPAGRVVAVPDADQTPEMLAGLTDGSSPESQFARRLAENGCLVLVPTLIDRQDTWSGDPSVWMTNQPHREWVYRPAYELGRHVIGYEIQKVLAAVDWLKENAGSSEARVGVVGHAEGGLIAFYSAALDSRIDAALVSGYFDSRQGVWQEPIYRNVFGLLHEFGDAEIASLIAPRTLIIEHSAVPAIDGPPAARNGRHACAAPGALRTPTFKSVRAEVERAQAFFPADGAVRPVITLVAGERGATVGPGSEPALLALLRALGCPRARLLAVGDPPKDARRQFDPSERQHRQLEQLVEHTQKLMRQSDAVRRSFWAKARTTSLADWQQSSAFYRDYLWDEVIGRFPPASVTANPRSRKILDRPRWVAYEVVLDVWPDVFVWCYLLVPKDQKPHERRPVVVCQHGLEGLPADVINDDPRSPAYAVYKAFAARLADRGFVVVAPHNFYRGGDEFRQLQRLANPLKKTLFGITAAQHGRLLDWLSSLDFVDPARIGFYGLSYGGFSAMRLPPLLPRYALAIDSAEFNDMVRKKASVHDLYSYPFYNTYEVFEFNLANTFGYADLAGLIAPRPFMVERGHRDGVAPDEWVAAEYAKVRRLYAFLGIPDRTAIEFFDGPHTIHGVGTFQFLHRHLRWPERKEP